MQVGLFRRSCTITARYIIVAQCVTNAELKKLQGYICKQACCMNSTLALGASTGSRSSFSMASLATALAVFLTALGLLRTATGLAGSALGLLGETRGRSASLCKHGTDMATVTRGAQPQVTQHVVVVSSLVLQVFWYDMHAVSHACFDRVCVISKERNVAPHSHHHTKSLASSHGLLLQQGVRQNDSLEVR